MKNDNKFTKEESNLTFEAGTMITTLGQLRLDHHALNDKERLVMAGVVIFVLAQDAGFNPKKWDYGEHNQEEQQELAELVSAFYDKAKDLMKED